VSEETESGKTKKLPPKKKLRKFITKCSLLTIEVWKSFMEALDEVNFWTSCVDMSSICCTVNLEVLWVEVFYEPT
jgi:hypothetical protein